MFQFQKKKNGFRDSFGEYGYSNFHLVIIHRIEVRERGTPRYFSVQTDPFFPSEKKLIYQA